MSGEVDPQVMLAATQMSNAAKQNPEWVWFNMVTATFGRWADHPSQAPYIRADLAVLATTHARTVEALREAEKAAYRRGWQDAIAEVNSIRLKADLQRRALARDAYMQLANAALDVRGCIETIPREGMVLRADFSIPPLHRAFQIKQ